MARTDNDTWDLASSVGVTATMMAAARAAASRSDNPLINDPFAEPLVAAVGVEPLTKLSTGEIDFADLEEDDDETAAAARRFADAMAARTKYFDVLRRIFSQGWSGRHSAGGDPGVWPGFEGLPVAWPDGTVVFEIDQPEVIEFKTNKLAELGAEPTADRRAVAVDLREDWPAALRDAGFDAAKPSAWIAEGLFGYLPPDAQDRLLDNITALSTPGSRIGCETAANPGQIDRDEIRQRMQTASDRWQRHGFDINFIDLVYIGERNEVPAHLATHGWESHGDMARELFARYGLEPPPVNPSSWGEMLYLTGILK